MNRIHLLRWLRPTPILVKAFLLAVILGEAGAADWPQFLGPRRDGSTAQTVSVPWPADGPIRRWKVAAGSGFSGPILVSGKVLLFDREQDEERVRALDLRSGKVLWEQRAPTAYVDDFGFDNGPRATPAATPNQVITFGAEGRLTCFDLIDGQRRWTVEAGRDLGADRGFFGPACSPLIVQDRVLLNLGSRNGGGIAAFALEDGRLLWKATDHEAGYASPVAEPGAAGTASTLWFFTREGLVGTSLDGAVRFTHPWRSRQHASVNAASPLVHSNEIFLTSSYDAGAILLRAADQRLSVVWSGDEALSSHYATPVLYRGFLYGFHGRQERGTAFRCVEWSTGRVRWSEEGMPAGTVILADDRLVLLLETGELLVVPAQAERFQTLARAQVLGRTARAPFALGDGVLVARDSRQWVCFEVETAK